MDDDQNIQIIEEIIDDSISIEDESVFDAMDAITHDHTYLLADSELSNSSMDMQKACTLCGEILPSISEFKRHAEDCRNGDKSYECEICSMEFDELDLLIKHKLNHDMDMQMVECEECQKLIRPDNITRHMRIHSDYKKYKCMFCDREFKFRTPWKMHEATHSDDQPFECSDCGVKFSTAAALRDHEDEKQCTKEPFSCIDCQIEYTRRMDYLRHLSEIHGGKLVEKNFPCSFCDKSFIFQSLLRAHEMRHIKEEPYQCNQCNQTFNGSRELRNHECALSSEDDEEGKTVLECATCSYKCLSKRTLSVHERTHNPGFYNCQFCLRKFIREDNWSKHIAMCQDGVTRLVPCPKCSMTFISIRAQRIHEGHKHKDLDSNPLVCPHHHKLTEAKKPCNLCNVCGKCFCEKNVLKKHLIVHTGERPYNCQYCGNDFTTRSAVLNHERTHTGERPHKCSFCGKCFTQRTSLVEHTRRHTKDMPHKCSFCGKGFMVPCLLKKHQQTHYKGKGNRSCSQMASLRVIKKD